MPTCLPEQYKIVDGAAGPVTTNGGVTGDYISLRDALRVTVIVTLTQAVGHATKISINKATTVAGAGATPITTNVPIWANEDVADSDTLVKQTDAKDYTVTADVKKKMVVFQIDPATLGAFDVIVAVSADSSQATNFVNVTYLIESRYPQATPPAAITD